MKRRKRTRRSKCNLVFWIEQETRVWLSKSWGSVTVGMHLTKEEGSMNKELETIHDRRKKKIHE